MHDSLSTLVRLLLFLSSLWYCVYCSPYIDDNRPLQEILRELLGKYSQENDHNDVRRQLNLGDDASSPKDPSSWSGRWFPDTVTEAPQTFNITGIGPSSWSGRWFPDKVTETPPAFNSKGIDPSSWAGRWFPEKVTEAPQTLDIKEMTEWPGRWFPDKATERPYHRFFHKGKFLIPDKVEDNSMWKMINSSCDDGKTNLTVDWSGSPINYTCSLPHRYFVPDYDLPGIILEDLIPNVYKAKHECMKKEIHYHTDLPTFGTHRPAWPRYGEYKFVPRQRWIHNLEHGAIVMLYHPCAHPELVNELREMVTGCLFRHIISPYTMLSPERPLALLAWGHSLRMAVPVEEGVTSFIQEHALRGPEAISDDGQFSEGLIKPAAITSDPQDSAVCPQKLF